MRGELGGDSVGVAVQPDEGQRGERPLLCTPLVGSGLWCAEERSERAGMTAPQAEPTSAFSSTLKSGNTAVVCCVPTTPCSARSRCDSSRSSCPPSSSDPLSAWSSPEITLSAVDFPEPLGPISACTDPGDSSSSSRSSASRLPNRAERPLTASGRGSTCPARPALRGPARGRSHPPPPGAGQWNQPRAAEVRGRRASRSPSASPRAGGGNPRCEPISSATFENAAITARPTTGPSGSLGLRRG